MKLVGLASLLVLLCLELLKCRWKLRQFAIHIGNLLVYLLQLFSETFSLGLQVSLRLLHFYLRLGHGDDLSTSHFHKIFPVVPLFDCLFLMKSIRKMILGSEDWNLMALDVCSRVQCLLK